MRTPPLLLGLSLAANLGLACAWFSHAKGSSSSSDGPAPVAHPAGAAVAPVASAAAATAAFSPEMAQALPAFFQQLMDGDFSTELSRLRTLGLSEETVSLIGQLLMMQKYKKAYEALSAEGISPQMLWGGSSARTDAQREAQRKMRQVQRELNEEGRKAGVDLNWFSSFGAPVPGLSADKARLAARIEQDRQELRSQVHMEASGTMLDRDTERLKYIDKESQKDLAAVLSPEELETWNLNRSETAQSLRAQLAYMAPTEEEFRQMHRLQEAFNEVWPSNYGPGTDWQKRNEAEQAMKKQIAEVLGPERYADYQKASDYEFGTLSNLEFRLELPKGTAERVYDLHRETEKAANKIRADKSLGEEDRKESLKVLAEQVKADMAGALGEEGFKAYQNQHRYWMDNLTR